MSVSDPPFQTPQKSYGKKFSRSDSLMRNEIRFEGYNEDITEPYYWHLNFAYYVGKGYTPFKLEDYHYFSENSQFGTQLRQVKGGSIKAFQENLAQLVQLVKVHMMPLLKELKQAEFYKEWMDKITKKDEIVQDLKSKGTPDENSELKAARLERNEAISHIKDKWVNEVDAGRIWQMNRSAAEQGLDFTLLPQLFFGINLDDPLQSKKSIKEQLDDDVYEVDISEGAKEQVARFMYRFHTWLPTAIKETQVTFKIKLASLRQFYTQLQMYINVMKPLLLEMNRKNEGLESSNFYHEFENENPEFVNLFDYSYSFVKVVGARQFGKKERGNSSINDLEFSPFGLFLSSSEIVAGEYTGRSGFVTGEEEVNGNSVYIFHLCDNKNISEEEFAKCKKVNVYKEDLRVFPIMEKDFSQKRRMEILQSAQGPQQAPYMQNAIVYNSYVWNIVELASYRDNLKENNLDLLESFVDEIRVIKEDLLYYINGLKEEKKEASKREEEQQANKQKTDFSLITGPVKGLGMLFSPFVPTFSSKKRVAPLSSSNRGDILFKKLIILEDTWKVYTIFKKAHGYMQY